MMTKAEFLNQLRGMISNLPPEEVERTIGYFSEIIDDRIEDGMSEKEAVAGMESVESIANSLVPMQTELKDMRQNSYLASRVRAIFLKDVNSPVRLVCSDSDLITLDYYESSYKAYHIDLSQSEELVIRCEILRKWSGLFGFNYAFRPFTLGIPKTYFGSLTLETTNGSISSGGVDVSGSLALKTSNGRITVENMTIGKLLSLKSANGRLALTGLKAGEISARTSNGKIEAINVRAEQNVALESSNSGIHVEHLFSGSSIRLVSSNGKISGQIDDSLRTFNVKSRTSNGSSTLPSNMGGGTKDLNVFTSNGRIDLGFLM